MKLPGGAQRLYDAPSMAEPADEHFMDHALELAARGRGWVEPNPMVGAVLVRDGRLLGAGHHQRCGGPHAEVEAIADARQRGHDPAGGTLHVNLEPCCHHGRTPPCTDAVIEAGIARVVVAMIDPAEHAAGEGLRRLREAGLEVTLGVREDAAHALNAPFVKRATTGLPWVVLKWAQTLDGRIATGRGDSQWISNEAARQRVHEWRARVDAIVVGIGTVLADNPRLTARHVVAPRLARRIVIDPDLRMPEDAQLLEDLGDDHPPLTLAIDRQHIDANDPRVLDWEARGVGIIPLPQQPMPSDTPAHRRRLDLEALMRELARTHEATNVFVEGGATLHGTLIEQGLADQVLAFVAPMLMGDDTALPAARGLRCDSVIDATELSLHAIERIGDNVLLDYRVR